MKLINETADINRKKIREDLENLSGNTNIKSNIESFRIDLICNLKKKATKSTIREHLTKLFSKEDN